MQAKSKAEPEPDLGSEPGLSPEEAGALQALLPKKEAEQRRVKLPLPCTEAHIEAVRQWETTPLVVTKEEVLAEAVKRQPEAAADRSLVSTWGPHGCCAGHGAAWEAALQTPLCSFVLLGKFTSIQHWLWTQLTGADKQESDSAESKAVVRRDAAMKCCMKGGLATPRGLLGVSGPNVCSCNDPKLQVKHQFMNKAVRC